MPTQIVASNSPIYTLPTSGETAGSNPGNSGVEYTRSELQARYDEYELIRDALGGQEQVKSKGPKYLPYPEGVEADWKAGAKSAAGARYLAYITRAVFYNVARRTLAGLSGQVSMKPAQIVCPPALDPVVKDATGTGVSLTDLGIFLVTEVLALGRAGILADFPTREGPTTRAEINTGKVRPILSAYASEDIINWRTEVINGRSVLVLVVLRECYEKVRPDGFGVDVKTQYRVLRLDGGKYTVQVWKKEDTIIEGDVIVPQDSNGLPLTEIPFMFIGAINNDTKIDAPPMYDLCSLNIAHYRNSADFEEAVFMNGQPTLVLSGLDKQWWEEVLDKNIRLGSRGGIPLPVDAEANLLEMEPNNAAKEAMEHKEAQMLALGAKLVEVSKVQATATESKLDEVSETSALFKIVTNVSAAVLWAFEWCAIFTGATTVNRDAKDSENKTIDFKLNTDFDFSGMSPEEVSSAINAWQQSAISFSEMRNSLTKSGLATLSVDAAKKEIRDDMADEIKTASALGVVPKDRELIDPTKTEEDEDANENAEL